MQLNLLPQIPSTRSKGNAAPVSLFIAHRRTGDGTFLGRVHATTTAGHGALSLSTATLMALFWPTADAVDSQTHMTIPPLRSKYPLHTGILLGSLDLVFLPIPIKEHGHVAWSASHGGKKLSAPHGQAGEKYSIYMLVWKGTNSSTRHVKK